MQFPGQLTGSGKTGIAGDRLGLAACPVPGDVSVQKGQNLPPLLVQSQEPGCARPSSLLQKDQQLVDEPRVAVETLADRAANGVPDPNRARDLTAQQHLLLQTRDALLGLCLFAHSRQSAALSNPNLDWVFVATAPPANHLSTVSEMAMADRLYDRRLRLF